MASGALAGARLDAMVRVRAETRDKLRELAGGQPLTQYLERLTEQEYSRRKLEQLNADYARLKADSQRWAAYREERAALDGTLMDGLASDEGVAIEDADADAATW
jgi:hypothetical protein